MGSDLEAGTERLIRRVFREKTEELGVDAVLDLRFLQDFPVVGKYVYGEAFPFETPPKVVLEVFAPDATEQEIRSIICEELLHIKHPGLQHGEELDRLIRACIGYRDVAQVVRELRR